MLTGGFNFLHGVSYWCSIVTIYLKRAVFAIGAWDRHRQTDDRKQFVMWHLVYRKEDIYRCIQQTD